VLDGRLPMGQRTQEMLLCTILRLARHIKRPATHSLRSIANTLDRHHFGSPIANLLVDNDLRRDHRGVELDVVLYIDLHVKQILSGGLRLGCSCIVCSATLGGLVRSVDLL
jgi:hypothetical protein